MPPKARSPRSSDEKSSDITLGKRLATLRKERGFTQAELAELVGVIQPIISDYERGRLRPHPDMLVGLAGALEVTTDELLGLAPTRKANGKAPNRRFLRRLQQIENLPKRDQEALLRTIDAFLSKSA